MMIAGGQSTGCRAGPEKTKFFRHQSICLSRSIAGATFPPRMLILDQCLQDDFWIITGPRANGTDGGAGPRGIAHNGFPSVSPIDGLPQSAGGDYPKVISVGLG